MKTVSYEELIAKFRDMLAPMSFLIELTSRCNLRCVHCARLKDPPGEMKTAQITRLLKDAREAGAMSVAFSGGEIFLRPDLEKLLSKASSLGYQITLITNGTLLKPEIIGKLKKIRLENVNISLYSLDPAVHDGITGVKGSHAKTVRAAELLRENGISVSFQTMVLGRNFRGIPAMERHFKDRDIPFTYDYMIFTEGYGALAKVRASDRAVAYVASRTAGKTEKNSRPAPGEMYRKKYGMCGMGRITFAVDARGELYPCVAFRRSAGNIIMEKFRAIWYNKKMQEMRRLRGYDFTDCLDCSLIKSCFICPGFFDAETGNCLKAAPERCRITRLTSKGSA